MSDYLAEPLTVTELTEFKTTFADLVKDLTNSSEESSFPDMPETNGRFERVLQENVPHGKQFRGLTTVLAYKTMSADRGENKTNFRLACILGWCVEIAAFLVLDDIMDGSLTRRQRTCWYLTATAGPGAINDGLFLEQCVYKVLRTHFAHLNCYARLLETFRDVTLKTIYGQSLDTSLSFQPDVTRFTEKLYKAVVKYKTSYYTFCLPINLAFILVDCSGKLECEKILLRIGYLFQVQDDYLDCFGSTEVTGKIGTDIARAKCTWLLLKALANANESQQKLLLENVGQDDEDKCEQVRRIYQQLRIPQLYEEFQREECQELTIQIMALGMTNVRYQKLLLYVLGKIGGRQA